MYNMFLMQVMNSAYELSEQTTSIVVFEITTSKDVFEQFASYNYENLVYDQSCVILLFLTRTQHSPEAHSKMIPMYFSVSRTSYSFTI